MHMRNYYPESNIWYKETSTQEDSVKISTVQLMEMEIEVWQC